MSRMEATTGWVYPTKHALKVHYIGTDQRSLCGIYAWFGDPEALQPDGGTALPEDCLKCRDKLERSA